MGKRETKGQKREEKGREGCEEGEREVKKEERKGNQGTDYINISVEIPIIN